MKFEIDGKVLSAERARISETCAAEKALEMSMGDGLSAMTLVMLFVAMKRNEPTKPVSMLTDAVTRIAWDDLMASKLDEDDADPPAVEANGSDPVSLPTTGTPA